MTPPPNPSAEARAMAGRLRLTEYTTNVRAIRDTVKNAAALLDRLATALETAEAGAAMFAVMAERRADVVEATDEETLEAARGFPTRYGLLADAKQFRVTLRRLGLRLIRAEPSAAPTPPAGAEGV